MENKKKWLLEWYSEPEIEKQGSYDEENHSSCICKVL
jgi:hypothetical protein